MVQNLCCSIYATLNGILLADLLLPAQGAKVVQGGASAAKDTAAKDTAACITLCFGQAPNGEPTYRVMSDYASDLPNSSNACNCSNIHIIHNTFN